MAGRAGLAALKALRLRVQQRSATRSRQRYRETGPSTVTNQHDFKRQYKSKKPSKRKRRLKKFARKIQHAQNLELPLHSLGEWNNTLIYCVAAAVGPSSQYVLDSSASTSRNDLRMLASAANGMAFMMTNINTTSIDNPGTIAGVVTAYDNWELNAQCVMQLAIRNVQTNGILVDVYECIAANDNVAPHATAYGSLVQCLANMNVIDLPAAAPLPRMQIANTGTTPFEAAGFAKHWKILNKSRVAIEGGEIISMQFKTKVNKVVYAKWEGKPCKKGVTKDFIIIACPSWGSDVTVGNLLGVEWTKHYHIRIPDSGKGGVQTSFNVAQSY